MQYQILLDRGENTKKVEEQEQARFVKSVLEALEAPIEFDPDSELSFDDKKKFRQALRNYNISIITDHDGGLEIFVERELIAKWHKCKYKLKEDRHEIDRSKRLFWEMTVDCWTIFDDQE